ncbi:MAG: metal-dependent hydrolase [Candidatus Micrarchaeota archaeon]
MEGRTHLFCTLMYLGAGAFVAFKAGAFGLFDSVAFLIAAMEGALLPDVDAPKSLGTKIKLAGILKYAAVFAKTIAYITKFGLYLVLKLVLWMFKKRGAEHRGIMHSFWGLILVCAFWLAIGYGALSILNSTKYFKDLLFIILGLLLGYLMHLWHDALTLSGVKFTKAFKISGWLKTGKHEWLLQLFFLIASSFAAHVANSVSPLHGAVALILAIPASYLFFGTS